MAEASRIEIFAPAKVNLFLHITGRRSDGYHTLDSLVGFVDVGDMITIEKATTFSFSVTGDFAGAMNMLHTPEDFVLRGGERYIDQGNLVVRAAHLLSDITGLPLKISITLEKNLPIAAGIGGGSADAAATVWGLVHYWKLSPDAPYIPALLERLGADVPVCYACAPRFMRGIGDVLLPPLDLPDLPILLVNPGVPCSTQDVFLRHEAAYKHEMPLSHPLSETGDLIRFLKECENDLYGAAVQAVPVIGNVIHCLNAQDEVILSRMSGSGATCFALFETLEACQRAAKNLNAQNPDWWVRCGMLNRPERY